MAPKKKIVPNNDVEKIKDEIVKGARAVGKAAEPLRKQPVLTVTDQYGNPWEQVVEDVDALDQEFGEEEVLQKESFMDFLQKKLKSGDTEVRVMQIGPRGELIDVSDKIKAGDLKPEDIRSIRDEDNGKTMPLGRDRQNREAAMRLLQEMVSGLQPPQRPSLDGWKPRPVKGKSESIRRMELILEDSDKILEHWKK
jgi:hypothetical protein